MLVKASIPRGPLFYLPNRGFRLFLISFIFYPLLLHRISSCGRTFLTGDATSPGQRRCRPPLRRSPVASSPSVGPPPHRRRRRPTNRLPPVVRPLSVPDHRWSSAQRWPQPHGRNATVTGPLSFLLPRRSSVHPPHHLLGRERLLPATAHHLLLAFPLLPIPSRDGGPNK